MTDSTKSAKQIQADREESDLANHLERAQWLTSPWPRWSCGDLVGPHTRHVLLLQSQQALRALSFKDDSITSALEGIHRVLSKLKLTGAAA